MNLIKKENFQNLKLGVFLVCFTFAFALAG